MQKFEIDINLEHIAEQRKRWNDAAREFLELVDRAMTRLIHEAAAQRMSYTEVARKSGFTSHQIKQRMKVMGLNPSSGKSLLSKQAADVLAKNAEILGIKPHEIDLMSPLAYLPAGPLLKHETSEVKDFPDPEADTWVEAAYQSWAERQGVDKVGNAHRAGFYAGYEAAQNDHEADEVAP